MGRDDNVGARKDSLRGLRNPSCCAIDISNGKNDIRHQLLTRGHFDLDERAIRIFFAINFFSTLRRINIFVKT